MHEPALATSTASARFTRLDATTAALSEVVTLPRVAAVVVERAAAAAEADGAVLAVLAPDESALEIVAAWGAGRPSLQPGARVPTDEPSPLAGAVRTRDVAFVAEQERAGGAWIALPLTVRNRTIGALGLYFANARPLDDEARTFLMALARQCALAIERAQLHEMESTARMEVEEEAARFRSLVQELDAIFWEADPETFVFSFVSARAETILGYPIERWTEPGFWASIIHAEDQTWAVDFCVQCTKKGEDHTFEYRLMKQDGGAIWVRDVVYVVRDAEGNASKLRGVMVDITRERERLGPTVGRVARVIGQRRTRSGGLLPAAWRLLSG